MNEPLPLPQESVSLENTKEVVNVEQALEEARVQLELSQMFYDRCFDL
jgi:hypothetical protein